MYLSEVLEHLSNSELSQIALGGAKLGGVQEVDYPKIISHINLCMMDLHKKFPLKKGTAIIQMFTEVNDYYLRSIYAVSDPTVPGETYRYILDSVGVPFTDTVLQIASIFNEDGDEISLNDDNVTTSYYTPLPDMVKVATPDPAEFFTVNYRTAPVKLDITDTNATTLDIDLPYQFLTALLAYIGHRAYMSLDKPDLSLSSKYYAKYAGICAEITQLGTLNLNNPTNIKLDRNGWV